MQNLILYAATVLIWGSTWFVITFQLGVVDPLLSIGYRFGIAGILILGFLAIKNRSSLLGLSRQAHLYIALQGFLLFCLNYWLFYIGTGYLTSGLVAVIFSTLTMMNIINQALFFKIRVNKQVVLGAAMGLVGIIAVFWNEVSHLHLHDAVMTGILFCIVASYVASLGNMSALRNSRAEIPVMVSNGYGMVYGAVFCIVIALALGKELRFDMSFDYIWSLAYLALLGSLAGFSLYLTLMKNIGADKAAYATVMFPIVALIISTFFEGYVWSVPALLGMALVVAGNVIAMTKRENLLHWRGRLFK